MKFQYKRKILPVANMPVTSQPPKISVVLPLYNSAPYVKEAVESILAQSFTDFELIIINDGSTDASRDIVASFDDRRIKIIDNEKNIGVIRSLNLGFSIAKGEYIARMDSDDISRPDRFSKQVKFLDKNPNVALVGTWFEYLDRDCISRPPADHEGIKYYSLFNSPFGHPTIMLRKRLLSAFPKDGPYSQDFKLAEDYELWCRIIDRFETANIPENLLYYRLHDQQVSSKADQQRRVADRIRLIQMKKVTGFYLPFEKRLILRLLEKRKASKWKRPLFQLWTASLLIRASITGYIGKNAIIRLWKECS